MRKNLKTIMIVIMSFLCTVCFFVGCSNVSDSQIFDDFKDEELTVSLGERYRLEIAPLGDGLDYYEITARVLDSKGAEVTVENGSFSITDVNGYVITYTASNGKDERNRTVVIKVDNERAPNIVFGNCDTTYEVGETFFFPAVTVYDLAGENLTPTFSVYKVEGEELLEQPLSNENRFLCENAGIYIFKVTATNSFQVKGENEFRFYVSGIECGEVESFQNEGVKNDVSVNSIYTNGFEWLEKTDATMGERQGVLKVDVKKTNQLRNILTVFPKQDYLNYLEKDGKDYRNKKFVVTMYVSAPVGSIPEMYAHFTSYRIKDVKYNMWYDYIFDAKKMLDEYQAILTEESKIANTTDEKTIATAQKAIENLQKNALSIWGTFRSDVTVYIDRIAFTESVAQTSIAEHESYEVSKEIDFAREMPIVGYENVEYTVLLAGKPIVVTSGKFIPEYVSDEYTVVASVKDSVNVLNDNAEFKFRTTAKNGETARLSEYTKMVNAGDKVIEPSITVCDKNGHQIEGYRITTEREFVSNAGERSEVSSFTAAKSGTFEYTVTAEKDGVIFIKTATIRVGPFDEEEVISFSRADVLELFGTTKGALLTALELNELKHKFIGLNDTEYVQVLRFTKNNSDKNFELNFKPVHTVEYYKKLANQKQTLSLSLYLASANENVTEFSVEMFQDKNCIYTVQANTWKTIEIPITAMLRAMEDNRLYPVNTWTHCAFKIKSTSTEIDCTIANAEFNLFLGEITLIEGANGDNYVQDW